MKTFIVWLVELITFNHIRGQHLYGQPSLRWWYTGTDKHQHGGWIFLSRQWFAQYK